MITEDHMASAHAVMSSQNDITEHYYIIIHYTVLITLSPHQWAMLINTELVTCCLTTQTYVEVVYQNILLHIVNTSYDFNVKNKSYCFSLFKLPELPL